jgi:hypothetical protein
MKTISETLALEIERWDDPGDYPSNAGSGPLPSYDYIAGVVGDITIKLEVSDYGDTEIIPGREIPIDVFTYVTDAGFDYGDDLYGVRVTKWDLAGWSFRDDGFELTLTAEEFDASGWEPEKDREYEPDFGDFSDDD